MVPVHPFPSPGGPAAEEAALLTRLRRRRLPLIAAGSLLAVLVGAGATLVPAGEGARSDVPVVADAPVAEAMAALPTTVTTVAPVAPAPAPRTAPEQPPADERAPTPIIKVGEIRIPKIGVTDTLYEGVTLTVIDRGPGHWPGSAMPGQLGNAVFAGHRVTHSKPFRNVDQLVAGDEIFFTTDQGEFKYTITKLEIVGPRDVWIVNPTPDATVTLFACHPPGSAKQRIVVRGVFAGSTSSSALALSAG